MTTEQRDYTTDKVAEMMRTYGQTVRTEPSEITEAEKGLSINLIFEELKEPAAAIGAKGHLFSLMAKALDKGVEDKDIISKPDPEGRGVIYITKTIEEENIISDLAETLDALADIRVVVDGTTNRYGMAGVIKPAFDDVHASNMSKYFTDKEEAEAFAMANEVVGGAHVFSPAPGVFLVRKNSDNKIIKPPHYTPANPSQFIK